MCRYRHWLATVCGTVAMVATVLGAAAAPAASAGDHKWRCPISMDDAITLEREQIEHLFRVRGIAHDLADKLAVDLQGKVEAYLSHSQRPQDVRARGLLFYIGNSETLCAMFWRIGDDATGSVFVVEELAASPAAIVPLIDGLVIGMQDAASGSLRRAEPRHQTGPVTRGATGLSSPGRRSAQDILAELSRLLFPGAIADHVDDLASLTIIPCLNIGIIPFSALDPGENGRPLVETTVINVEAELRHIYEHRVFGWDGDIRSPVVFGNPDATTDADWSFPRLPGAESEALAIAARFDAEAVVGGAVTPDQVMHGIIDADYVHIAAHGLSSVADPLDGSFLALSGGRLTARQIQELELRGMPLVVLSACQTGLGGPLDAGIIGLARGFVIAGAIATVATLWNVDDGVTAEIMEEFAANLAAMSPGEALRLAQVAARQRHQHPRYWSGFMLFGSRIVSVVR